MRRIRPAPFAARAALVLSCCCASLLAYGQTDRPLQPEPATGRGERSAAHAREFMVAAAHPLAVDAGVMMLERGGSAMDAAIAAQLVLNLVEPHASGLGGGAYLLYHEAEKGTLRAYDGRETAPAAASPELFVAADGKAMSFQAAAVGGRAVGVPGLARLLETAHRRHGRRPWKTLFEPAIALAERGYPLTARVHAVVARTAGLADDAEARALYFDDAGMARPAGTQLRNPRFAATLRALAAGGAEAFYQGAIARDIVAAVRNHAANPGVMSEQDLAAYTVREVEALCAPYRRFRVCGMPPSSSGGIAVLQMLGILSRFDLTQVRPGSSEAAHLIAEAGRLAYADRDRYVADDRYAVVPTAGLLDPRYLAERAALIRSERSMQRAEPGRPAGAPEHDAPAAVERTGGTSHLSVVDREGNAVALTSSIESSFGARVMARGFFLNNQLTDFSFLPTVDGRSVANRVEPGKRPRSSMSPTLVYGPDGKLLLVIGSPGGSLIINYVVKALVAVLDWQMDVQAAIDAPNIGSRNGATELERGTPAEALAATLSAMGHPVRVMGMTSGAHGILRTPRGLSGGADPRREGVARGR